MYTILKNCHYSIPPRLGFSFKENFKWLVQWNNSCKYDLQSVDQWDINKLCGLRLNLFSNHIDSFRFGWLYNTKTSLIDIYAYYYINSQRAYTKITSVTTTSICGLELKFLSSSVEFIVNGISYSVNFSSRGKIKYHSGLYFGGNRPAPHTIKIIILEQ